MSERTPTPWTIVPGVYDTSPEASEFPHGPEIIGVGGNSVASCNMFGEANAAFIVTAVNSHDAMRDCLEWINRKGGMGLDVHERIRDVLASIKDQS